MSKKKNLTNQELTLQVVIPDVATPAKKKTHGNNGVHKITQRSFEQRFERRYVDFPPLPRDLEKPTFSESALKVLKERYLLKGDDLQPAETVEERFWHIAYDLASADLDFGATKEQVYNTAIDFYRFMVRQEFMPNSPTIMNAGKYNGLQYSACFVLPVDDSLPDIFDSIKYAALIHQTGGGTGFAFSRLRPAGSPVKTSGGVASGPVSFLRVFNAATEAIKQGGTRRGANMGILRVDHPDIYEFIRCKAELDDLHKPVFDEIAPFLPDDEVRRYFKTKLLDTQISNFNISVAITDKFMKALSSGGEFDLIDPRTREVSGQLNAKVVFDEIVERAWHTGDPGLVFIDRINQSTSNPLGEHGNIESTNPCGEQPLEPWDACNLGSINLGKFVRQLADGNSDVDWVRLKEASRKAVHMLDNVVQVNPYTLKQIYEKVHNIRRIGLGVMGWADMLFKLGIPYNSKQALELAEEVMKTINEEGHRASEDLAVIRGPFPDWSRSIYKNDKPLRNATVTTIAPTGTISIIADCSSGIEPVFALAYIHKARSVGDQYRILTIANQTFTEIAKSEGFYTDDLAQKVLEHGSVCGIAEVPQKWQNVFITAPEIDSDTHVLMQAAFQKYTDNGVSKTINMPNSATVEDVRKAYLLAWETGCSGITIYRDGSKSVQVLNVSSTLKPIATTQEEHKASVSQDTFVHRPLVLTGRTYKLQTPVGEGYITINRDEKNQPFEVFVNIGKGGTHALADAEAVGRLISMALRLSRSPGVTPNTVARKIADQLRNIGGASHIGFGKERIMSLADAIGKAMAEDIVLTESGQTSGEILPLNLTESTEDPIQSSLAPVSSTKVHADICPECGMASLVFAEGCSKCYSCGFSKC